MKIRIVNRPQRLISAIRAVRVASGMSLREAKDAVDMGQWFEVKVTHASPGDLLEELREAGAVVETKCRVRICSGWEGAGREGRRLGPDVFVRQSWTPVLWDDMEDPDWHKAAGLEAAP